MRPRHLPRLFAAAASGGDARPSLLASLAIAFFTGSLLGPLAGCGDAGEGSAGVMPPGAPLIARADAAPSFVVQMEGVLDRTAFMGTRVVWTRQFESPVGAKQFQATGAVIETRQLVAADGNGSYALELVDALQLPAAMDASNFAISFERSVDAQWRLREFRVHSFDATLENYGVTVKGAGSVVAGIPCQSVELVRYAPFDDRPGRYIADVDPATGFVLGLVEFDLEGRPLGSFQYESFTYAPDLSGVQLRSGSFISTDLDLAVDIETQTGFLSLVPDIYPEGFALMSATAFTVPASLGPASIGPGGASGTAPMDAFLPTGDWLRLIASDGIEAIAFAHAEADQVLDATAEAAILRVVEEGSWRVAFGQIRGIALVCSGRVGHEPLRRLVESAF